ncbi:MAG: YHS domain-containing protein, partial [Alphaproteobacteria bacterium]|nr:YHS domain-containing protein [Alphaproteobacteria bacterium]
MENNRDPVCGMTPNPETARAKGNWLSYQGKDYFFCCAGCKAKFETDPQKYLSAAPRAEKARDPVCGMTPFKDVAKAKGNWLNYQGTDYYFCCAGCKVKFAAEPEKYLTTTAAPHDHHGRDHHAGATHPPAPAKGEAKNAIYTCPMHPEVKQVGPGDCPICGMALEPADPAAAQDDSEYRDMLNRFKVSLALAVPVFVLAMLGDTGKFDALISPLLRDWIEAALS